MKLILNSFLFFFMISCATNLSENVIRESSATITGGRFQDQEWKDVLNFKRTSWFRGANLQYDFYLAKLDKNSPFMQWSEGSLGSLTTNCESLFLSFQYSKDSGIIPYSLVRDNLEKSGFKKIDLSRFVGHLRSHPSYENYSLRSYKVDGYCGEVNAKISLSLPGFKQANIL